MGTKTPVQRLSAPVTTERVLHVISDEIIDGHRQCACGFPVATPMELVAHVREAIDKDKPDTTIREVAEAFVTEGDGWRAGVLFPDGRVAYGEHAGWAVPEGTSPMSRAYQRKGKKVPYFLLDDGTYTNGTEVLYTIESRMKRWVETGERR